MMVVLITINFILPVIIRGTSFSDIPSLCMGSVYVCESVESATNLQTISS